MKLKATGCGSISTVFFSIVSLCVSSIIIITTIIIITITMIIIVIIIIMIIILPETRKYWVDVQRGIVLSHGERDPL